jgi:hypothetical protein
MRDIDEERKSGVKEVRNAKTKAKGGNNDEERKQEARKERTKIENKENVVDKMKEDED